MGFFLDILSWKNLLRHDALNIHASQLSTVRGVDILLYFSGGIFHGLKAELLFLDDLGRIKNNLEESK